MPLFVKVFDMSEMYAMADKAIQFTVFSLKSAIFSYFHVAKTTFFVLDLLTFGILLEPFR